MKHIVGFSGGIDSQAAARWVLNRFDPSDVILLNSDAGGNEHPLTTEFIAWYSANVHEVVTVSAIYADAWETEGYAERRGFCSTDLLTFDKLIALKGPPSRKRRHCTEVLKLRPQQRWIREQFGPSGRYAGEDYERYTGLRRDESEARRNTVLREWDQYFDCWLNHPAADWTKQMCFDYVKAHGERINELYALGFDRVGCAPCINSDKSDILNWEIRSPDMIEKLRNWEKTITLPNRELPGFNFFVPLIPGVAENNIDDVIAWAKTSRGGRQSLLPIMHERPACESKYGLCE